MRRRLPLAAVLVVLLWATPARAQWANPTLLGTVQPNPGQNGGSTSGVNTATACGGVPCTFIVAALSAYTCCGTPAFAESRTGCASPCNSATTVAGSAATYGGVNFLRLYYIYNATTGANHIFTASGTTYEGLIVLGFSGGMLTDPGDTEQTAVSPAGTTQSLALASPYTPTVADSLIVTAVTSGTTLSANLSVDGSFAGNAQIISYHSGGNLGSGISYVIQSGGPSSVNPTWSSATDPAVGMSMAVRAFKPPAGGGGGSAASTLTVTGVGK